MKNIDANKTKIIHHISRIEGQLASLKRQMQQNQPDCQKTSQLLRASSRSFSSLREAYVRCLLEEKYIDKKKVSASGEELTALFKVISSS